MTQPSGTDARSGPAEPSRPASQRELVIQSLIRRPDDATKRGV